MEELYMYVIKFFATYGWQMTILALSGIFLLGVLKSVKAFDWIKIYSIVEDGAKILEPSRTKQVKKIVYTIISAGLSVIVCCIYLYVINVKLTSTLVLTISGTIWSMNTITYMLYENLGVRSVWKLCLAKMLGLFNLTWTNIKAKIQAEKNKKIAQNEAKLISAAEKAKLPEMPEMIKAVAEYLGIDIAYLEMLKKIKS